LSASGIHQAAYQEYGFEIVDVAVARIVHRAAAIASFIARPDRGQRAVRGGAAGPA
jgi:hypothetical protein